jgi:RNA polymerase sigma-70 factor (ECF subfamily)
MVESELDQATHATLAREAGPVRRWLTGYFRRRVRNDDEVEDLVQDVFARIVARDSETPVEHLGGYVARTAASVLADRGRRRSSRHADFHVEFDADRHADEEIDPERVLSGKEDLHAATAALLSLPERTRAVFVLRRLEGYRHGEIARHLGISVSAVEKHMVRAIRHLSTAMEKRHAS